MKCLATIRLDASDGVFYIIFPRGHTIYSYLSFTLLNQAESATLPAQLVSIEIPNNKATS